MSILRNIVKWAYTSLQMNDTGEFPTIQVTTLGNVAQNITLIYPYGYNASPSLNTVCLILNVQGNEDNKVAFVLSGPDREKTSNEGEVVIFNPKTKSKIFLDKNGNIDIQSSGVVNINGDTEPIVRGGALKTLFNSHTHTSAGSGSPSSAPIQQMSATELSTKNFTE